MNKLFQHLAQVSLDLSFSQWQSKDGTFVVTTPPGKVVRGLSLLFWLPLLFLGAAIPRLVAHSAAWLVPMGLVGAVLFAMGWMFFWTGYERTFDKRRRRLTSVVKIVPFRREMSFELYDSPGSLKLSSRYSTEGAPGSIKYSMKIDAIPPCHWVIYNNYPRALEFAKDLSSFLEVSLDNQVLESHRA